MLIFVYYKIANIQEAKKVEKIVKILLTLPLQIGGGLAKYLHNSGFI